MAGLYFELLRGMGRLLVLPVPVAYLRHHLFYIYSARRIYMWLGVRPATILTLRKIMPKLKVLIYCDKLAESIIVY